MFHNIHRMNVRLYNFFAEQKAHIARVAAN